MAQHDQVINNAAGATVLVDMNAAFGAIFSSSSGPIEPNVKQAGQLWFDTLTATLNIRNAANSGWMQFTLGFNPADTYGKAEADARFAQILTTYTKAQADARFAQTANTYTKAEVDAKFASPLADTLFAPSAAPTKKAHFDFSLITAGQDRAIKVPDKPGLALGGWELITDEDFGTVTSKAFLNLGAYHALWLVTDLYPVSAVTYPMLQFSADNGATWLTTNYYYNMLYSYNSATNIYGQSAITDSKIYLSASAMPVGPATHGAVAELKLWGFNKPRWTCGIMKNAYHSSTSGVGNMSQSCGIQASSALNAINILAFNVGVTLAGRVTLHGLRG